MKTVEQVLDELAKYITYTAFQVKGRVTIMGPLNFTEDVLEEIAKFKAEQKQVSDE